MGGNKKEKKEVKVEEIIKPESDVIDEDEFGMEDSVYSEQV